MDAQVQIEYTADGIRKLLLNGELRWASSDKKMTEARSMAKATIVVPQGLAEIVLVTLIAGLNKSHDTVQKKKIGVQTQPRFEF